MKLLSDYLSEQKIKKLAIIGLAKNVGKTVTFNTIIKETVVKNLRLGLVSYGRDGEALDALNRHEKPRIIIPRHAFFVTTASALAKSKVRARLWKSTGITTVIGEVNIYLSESDHEYCELIGINSLKNLKVINDLLQDEVNLLLIDGALERKSSGVPHLADAVIIATGAVLAKTEKGLISKTLHEIDRFFLPLCTDAYCQKIIPALINENKNALIFEDKYHILDSSTSFGLTEELKHHDNLTNYHLFLKGAITDNFVENLVYDLKINETRIIVKDPSCIFLSQRSFKLLEKSEIQLMLFEKIKVLAITVNPFSPFNYELDSNILITELKKSLPPVPVINVKAPDYLSIR